MVDFTQSDGFVTDAGGRRQYANRDDAALIPGTEIDATDRNQVRNELVYLVSQAGLTPSNGDLTQVYQAVRKLVLAGASSVAVGFVPVEQGGNTGLTADKINIGNSGNGLAACIAGKLWGIFASQDWANNAFVKNNAGTSGGIVALDLDGAGTGRLAYMDQNGAWHVVQPAGDYATNTALSNETTRATTVESNLQSSKVNRSGDTMNGPINIQGTYGDPTGYSWSEVVSVVNTAMGSSAQFMCASQYGSDTAIRLKSLWGNGNSTNFDFHQAGRISSAAGDVAFVSDLPLPLGQHIQAFNVTIPRGYNIGIGSAPFVANLPKAFANFITALGGDIGNSIYTVAASPANNRQVNIWVSNSTYGSGVFPAGGDIVVTIYAIGTY